MRSMKKMTCHVLIASLLALSFQTASAGMIAADQASTAPADRSLVLGVLDRGETTARLQAMGVDPALARERVNAMTDQEVRTLASSLQSAPVGADGGTVLAVILIAGLVWYFAYRK